MDASHGELHQYFLVASMVCRGCGEINPVEGVNITTKAEWERVMDRYLEFFLAHKDETRAVILESQQTKDVLWQEWNLTERSLLKVLGRDLEAIE